MFTMDHIIKSSNQWKYFDFGPPTKNPSTTSVDFKKNFETKTVRQIKNKNELFKQTKETFNFHEKLTPKSLNDLAVHPKKLQEVEEWLKINTLQAHNRVSAPFLLISGPTGSGKTSTVTVICKTLKISISEWVNPIDQEYEYKGMNQIDQFIEFLSESKYNSLFENSKNRVTLVKDFPNAIIQNPQEFFEVLETCKSTTRQPVIFICTDASSSNLNLQRTLFPEEIMLKYNISHISFNICAPSLMKSAIRRAQELVILNSDKLKLPSSGMVEAILVSAAGDIRTAINQYHVASLMGIGDVPLISNESEKKTAKRKRSNENTKTNSMFRDQTLGLFHGLGRVLNPKRKVVGDSWRLSHNIESLIDEFSTQPQMFSSFLFENYLKYFGDITDVSKSAEILSLSMKFFENWERHETLIFGLWISVLGLMIYNEHRLSKWNQIRGPTKITKKNIQNHVDTMSLDATDYYYYNIITKSNKFHRFNFNF
ncbi:cell cycle checkpoint protein RAD17 [Diorhabda carinulata]|uniref:cell cycle checkpoint protein RAD17 n=1 Tax=Diorhabda carinulata TaxID=1163345 RepID=UPI0025A0C466|nr:cell cycle checkpoint protein RAD17 [Diorhabda carinulata]